MNSEFCVIAASVHGLLRISLGEVKYCTVCTFAESLQRMCGGMFKR